MNTPLPTDTRREAAYDQCHSVLDKIKQGRLDYAEGIVFLMQMLYFAEVKVPKAEG